MIEFRGKLSQKSMNFMIKRERKNGMISGGIASAILLIPVIICSIKIDPICSLFILVLILLTFLSGAPLKKNELSIIAPNNVYIVGDEIVSKSERFSCSNLVESVTKVEDYGEFYFLKFDYSHRCGRFICQKDLITQGTIEEFEEIFKDKIVREVK